MSPQEKPKSIDALPQAPTIVTGGKAQRILHVGQRVRFVSANGVRTYDGIFAIEDALGPWILVRDEERNWWVNLSAIEGVEVVP